MKKTAGIIAGMLCLVASVCSAVDYGNHFYNQRVYRVALGSGNAPSAADMALIRLHNGDMVLNTDDGVLYIMQATNVYTSITAAGVVTANTLSVLNGELEVNNSVVDVNMTVTNNQVTITQTNTSGIAAVSIDSDGVYALDIVDGILRIESEIDSALDIVIDPGTNLIVEAPVDATSYTADASSGIDVQSAGALDIGNTTATSIDYGSASVTAHTFTSDGTGTGEVVLPDESIGDAEIADVAASKLTGNIAIARVTNALAGLIASATIVNGAIADDQLVTTSTVTVVDINGSALSDYAAIRAWLSLTAAGAVSTNNVEDLVLTGTEVAETVADGDYSQVTTSAGTLTATMTSTAVPFTNYLNVSVGPYVVSSEVVLTAP